MSVELKGQVNSIFLSALLNVVFVANYIQQRQLQMMFMDLFCKMANSLSTSCC